MKILLVEDEPRIATYLRKGLRINQYVVDIATDGERGYDLASTEQYDLLILDRMLPKLDGLKLCQKVRKTDQQIPILLLTAKDEVADRVAGLAAGADDYLGKPFAFSELLARIKALTRRRAKPVAQFLQIDSLKLNLQNYCVTRAGQTVELSKKEYALLEFLVRHPGQIFSSQQLIERVWSFTSDVLPNTAQVYIGYLRKKIDKAFPQERPLFKTVRGFGYKLE